MHVAADARAPAAEAAAARAAAPAAVGVHGGEPLGVVRLEPAAAHLHAELAERAALGAVVLEHEVEAELGDAPHLGVARAQAVENVHDGARRVQQLLARVLVLEQLRRT